YRQPHRPLPSIPGQQPDQVQATGRPGTFRSFANAGGSPGETRQLYLSLASPENDQAPQAHPALRMKHRQRQESETVADRIQSGKRQIQRRRMTAELIETRPGHG